MKKKILLAWSSGKDSAWALHVLRQQNQYEIAGLMTTLNAAFDRVAMHSTRRALVEMQAEAARTATDRRAHTLALLQCRL